MVNVPTTSPVSEPDESGISTTEVYFGCVVAVACGMCVLLAVAVVLWVLSTLHRRVMNRYQYRRKWYTAQEDFDADGTEQVRAQSSYARDLITWAACQPAASASVGEGRDSLAMVMSINGHNRSRSRNQTMNHEDIATDSHHKPGEPTAHSGSTTNVEAEASNTAALSKDTCTLTSCLKRPVPAKQKPELSYHRMSSHDSEAQHLRDRPEVNPSTDEQFQPCQDFRRMTENPKPGKQRQTDHESRLEMQ